MATTRAVDIVRFTTTEIAALGETVTISAETGGGESIALRLDPEVLAAALPTLMGLVGHAREKGDADLPPGVDPGPDPMVRALKPTHFAIRQAKGRAVLEFRLPPQGFPLVLSMSVESARHVCTRFLQTLNQG